MSEKRFVHIEHKGADYILDSPNWDLDFIEMLGDSLEPKEVEGLLNTQAEEISYWKHKVISLLWILGQFDEEKVKELLKEIKE